MRTCAWIAGLLAAILALAGCSAKKTLAPNAPPDTRLFVQFDPADTSGHTVHHEVHLYWFGSDADGYVVAYEYRFLGGPLDDPPWSRTTRPDSVFALTALEDTVTYVFQVRAIDDGGEADPTPASQELSLRNQAPIVTLLNPPVPRDTSYASLTLTWRGIDPDGDANDLEYKVWLTGNESGARRVRGTTFTIPSTDFLIDGHYSSRPRTVNVQAFDVGGRPSATASATWFVRSPAPDSTLLRGSVLIVTEMSTEIAGGRAHLGLYTNAVAQTAPARSYSVLQLQYVNTRPFRSAADLLQTFQLYDAVLWYRGIETSDGALATILRTHQSSVGEYIAQGGRFYLESFDMFQGQVGYREDDGILSQEFLRTYAGSDGLYRRYAGGESDSTVDLGIQQAYRDVHYSSPTDSVVVNSIAILRSTVYGDSLRQSANYSGLRGLLVRDTNDVALWARDSVLYHRPPYDVPIGVTVAHPGGGRFVGITTPVQAANSLAPGFQGNAVRFLGKIIQQMLAGATPRNLTRAHPAQPVSSPWRDGSRATLMRRHQDPRAVGDFSTKPSGRLRGGFRP